MYDEYNTFRSEGGAYRLIVYQNVPKACDKTNEDRNVIPKASENSFQNPNSAIVRHQNFECFWNYVAIFVRFVAHLRNVEVI